MATHGVFYEKLVNKKNSYYALFALCVFMVSVNILVSQSYPPLMYEVIEGDPVATTHYLKQIWGSPLFVEEMNVVRASRNTAILQQIQKEDDKQNAMIHSLIDLTIKYPYAPEPYYNLSLMYEKKGDVARAQEFLKKAQQIDPSYR